MKSFHCQNDSFLFAYFNLYQLKKTFTIVTIFLFYDLCNKIKIKKINNKSCHCVLATIDSEFMYSLNKNIYKKLNYAHSTTFP